MMMCLISMLDQARISAMVDLPLLITILLMFRLYETKCVFVECQNGNEPIDVVNRSRNISIHDPGMITSFI